MSKYVPIPDIQFNENYKDYPIDVNIDNLVESVCRNNPFAKVWYPCGNGKTWMTMNPMRGWFYGGDES